MFIALILVLGVFLIFSVCQEDECSSKDTCFSCMNETTTCKWCISLSECVVDTLVDSECPKIGNINFLVSQKVEYVSKKLHLPPKEFNYSYHPIEYQKCTNPVHFYNALEECPVFRIGVNSDIETTMYHAPFLVETITPQPRINLYQDSDPENESFLRSTFVHKISVTLGMFFLNTHEDVKIYSFVEDTLHEPIVLTAVLSSYATSDRYKFIGLTDVTTFSRNGVYDFGFAIALQRGNETFCMYQKSKQKLNIQSSIAYVFTGTLDAILLFLSLGIVSLGVIILFCFQDCFYGNNKKRIFNKIIFNNLDIKIQPYRKSKAIIFLYQKLKMITSLFYLPKSEIIKQLGNEAWLFLRFEFIIVVAIFVMSLLSLVVLTPTNSIVSSISKRFETEYASDVISKSTSTAISFGSYVFTIHSVVFLLYFVVLIFVVYTLHRLSRSDFVVMNEGKINVSLLTVRVRNIDRDVLNPDTVEKVFKRLYGEAQVFGCHIAYDLEKLDKIIKRKEKLEKRKKKKPKHLKEIDILNGEIESYKNKREKEVKGSGTAFVTFNSIEQANKCVKEFSKSKFREERFFIPNGMYCELGLKSSTINWNNLAYSRKNRIFRYICVYFFVILVIILATNIVLVIQLFNITVGFLLNIIDLVLEYLFSYFVTKDPSQYDRSFFASLISNFNFVVQAVPIVLTVINLFMVPIAKGFAEKYKNQTKRGVYKSHIQIGSVMILLNTFIFGQLFGLIVYNVIAHNKGDTEFMMINFSKTGYSGNFVMSIVFKALEMLVLVWPPMIKNIINNVKRKIKDKENRDKISIWELERPATAYSGTYSLRFLFFMWVVFFGVNVPLIPILLFLSMLLNYVVDRFLIFYFYKKSENIEPTSLVMTSYFTALIALLYPIYFMVINYHYYRVVSFLVIEAFVVLLSIINVVVLVLIHYSLKKKRFLIKLKEMESNNKELLSPLRASVQVEAFEEEKLDLKKIARQHYQHPLFENINLKDRLVDEIVTL